MVSVIVPIYKTEQYLKKCIDSLLSQTYKDIEIILVDDGSPDGCPGICDEYAAKDERIRVIHRENGGLSAARNSGIDASKGDFLMFVDSDDYVSPQYVEKTLKKAIETDSDIVFCNYMFVNELGEEIPNDNYTYYKREDCFDSLEALSLFENKAYRTFFDISCNKLYKRDLFDDLRFPEGVSLVEDISIMPILYHRAQKLSVVEDKLYFYFCRSDSISHTKIDKDKDISIRVPMMEKRLEYYREWGIKELILSHLVHMYSLYAGHSAPDINRLESIQREFRKIYFGGSYSRRPEFSRKIKFMVAAVSLKLYNKLVNAG